MSGAREDEGPCALLRTGLSDARRRAPGAGDQPLRDNLSANPDFTFHLKHGVQADLPAEAEVITDPAERRRVFADIVDDFNARNGAPGSPCPKAVLDEWVERSPLALIRFEEAA